MFFDWDDPAAYPGALAGTNLIYLVTPVLRVRYAGSEPTGDIETVIGRAPTSFEAFAQRNAAAWTTPEDK